MTNDCENVLTVSGKKTEREAFVEKAKGNNGILDFNSFVPMPEQWLTPSKTWREGEMEWRKNHWFGKWNACGIKLIRRERSVVYKFETAWSTPYPVIQAMSKIFPNLRFKVRYFTLGFDDGPHESIFRNGKQEIADQKCDWKGLVP